MTRLKILFLLSLVCTSSQLSASTIIVPEESNKSIIFDTTDESGSKGKINSHMLCIEVSSLLNGEVREMQASAYIHFVRYQENLKKGRDEIQFEWIGMVVGGKCFELDKYEDERTVIFASAPEGPVAISLGRNRCFFEDRRDMPAQCRFADVSELKVLR